MSAARFLLPVLVMAWPPLLVAGDDEADEKTVMDIMQEIDLVKSLYAKDEASVKFKALPKFSAKKLAGYGVDSKQTVTQERARFDANLASYAKDFPLRAAIFDAAAQMTKLPVFDLPMTLPGADLTPKTKAAFLMRAADKPGVAIFRLESLLAHMKEADEQRAKETSKRWRADFDVACARLQTNLVFLYEYSYTLGQIRADNLPELAPGDMGWRLAFPPKITITESKAKWFAKNRAKLWQKIQNDYPGTPWAYVAERESQRPLGMQWRTMKK